MSNTNNYLGYDLLLLPIRYYTEGVPGTLLDAYAARVPVVVTNWKHAKEVVIDGTSGIIIDFDNPDIVEDGKNGYLFNPLDVEDIANKLLMITGINKDGLTQMECLSRQLAERRFAQDKFVNSYIDIIQA